MAIQTVDLRGLKCPLPALMAKRTLTRAPAGTAIEFVTDDPLAPLDLPHMCRQEGFEMISLKRDGDIAHMVLRR